MPPDQLPYLPSRAAWHRLTARRNPDPPWWWKPWLTPWFTLDAWWHRPRPVNTHRKDQP